MSTRACARCACGGEDSLMQTAEGVADAVLLLPLLHAPERPEHVVEQLRILDVNAAHLRTVSECRLVRGKARETKQRGGEGEAGEATRRGTGGGGEACFAMVCLVLRAFICTR